MKKKRIVRLFDCSIVRTKNRGLPRRKAGQSLVEVLVALGIATIILSAIGVAVISSLRNTQFSQNQNLATQYASQGMEIVRNIRDNEGGLDFYVGKRCLGQGDTKLISWGPWCSQNIDPRNFGPTPGAIYTFVREVNILKQIHFGYQCDSTYDLYHIEVTVSWWDKTCGDTSIFCHKVKLKSCLAPRKSVPTP